MVAVLEVLEWVVVVVETSLLVLAMGAIHV